MKNKAEKEKIPAKSILKTIGWIFAYLFTFLAGVLLAVYLLMFIICKGPSPAARDLFVATMLETGNMKFVVKWYLSEDEILAITSQGDTDAVYSETDISLVNIPASSDSLSSNMSNETKSETAGYDSLAKVNALDDPDGDGIILVPVTGRTFAAQLLVVRDPSKVRLATAYPFSSMEMEKNGYTVGEYAENNGAVASVNAGEFETPSGINWGGRPIGVVVHNSEVEFAEPAAGDVLVGFNENNILVVADIGNMSYDQFVSFVESNQIRDGASFKDLSDGNTNHFTHLITNGEAVDLNGKGGGANPRTAIGQCSDGTVLILVTDGRGSAGHLGATGQDLINIMQEYGAVNAANLDGGSSSSLYYRGEYQITSSFLPNSDASRRLPTSYIVMP